MKNTTLSFSKEQLVQIIANIKASGESHQRLFQVFLEAMMLAEREEYKLEKDDVSNGFRSRRLIGTQGIIELSVPRTRYGNFYPILLSIVKDQKEAPPTRSSPLGVEPTTLQFSSPLIGQCSLGVSFR